LKRILYYAPGAALPGEKRATKTVKTRTPQKGKIDDPRHDRRNFSYY
jgi:hypothetical protein